LGLTESAAGKALTEKDESSTETLVALDGLLKGNARDQMTIHHETINE
jgi:hypothetical protein